MKGWCAIPESMNSIDLVQALSLTQIPGHTKNKERFRNFSWKTQMFTRESPHHLGVRDYFSRRKSSALQMRATAPKHLKLFRKRSKVLFSSPGILQSWFTPQTNSLESVVTTRCRSRKSGQHKIDRQLKTQYAQPPPYTRYSPLSAPTSNNSKAG